jgi:hypothetical protein
VVTEAVTVNCCPVPTEFSVVWTLLMREVALATVTEAVVLFPL